MKKHLHAKFFKDCFTGVDGETYDLARVLLFIAVMTAIVLTIYIVVWKGSPFDIQTYGIAIGGMLFGGGAALWVKRQTEPTVNVVQTKIEDSTITKTETKS